MDGIEVENCVAVPTSTFSNDEVWNVIIKFDGEKEECNRLNCIDYDGNAMRLQVAKTSDFEVLGSKIISENDKYIMRASVKVKSSLTVLEGYMDIPFDSKRGWNWEDRLMPPSITLTKIVEADYQKALGTFSGDIRLSYYIMYVEAINTNEGYANIKMRYNTFYSKEWLNNGNVMKVPFNLLDASMNLSNYIHITGGVSVGYDPERDVWDGLKRK